MEGISIDGHMTGAQLKQFISQRLAQQNPNQAPPQVASIAVDGITGSLLDNVTLKEYGILQGDTLFASALVHGGRT